jgi:hypothetical protein
MLRNPEDLTLILADKFVVGRDIPAPHPLYKGDVGMRLEFTCYRLDGRHGLRMREML